jgi:hypothetical protein
MQKRETALDLLLSLARQTRENKANWNGGFSIDKSILEFAQNKTIITYRQTRNLIKLKYGIKKLKKDFIFAIEKVYKPENPYVWTLFLIQGDPDTEPAFFPRSVGDDALISHKEEIRLLLEKHPLLLEKNRALKKVFDDYSNLTNPIHKWIQKLFIGGSLEREIEGYQKQKGKKKNKTLMSRSLVTNFMIPAMASNVEKEGELPALSTSERQTLQFLFSKLENMTERERHLKNLLLEGKEEKTTKNGLLIVFEAQEAIKNSYGQISVDGYHYRELKDALKELCEKQRKLILKNDKDELKISIPLIKKVEIEHKYSFDPEFKKYTVVYIDEQVINLQQQYTSFPSNHFAIIREAPPKTRLTSSETAFFDFLYTEVSFDIKKTNIVKRKKSSFLAMLDVNGSVGDSKHISRLASRVEEIYVSKAKKLGLLEEFKIDTNKDGEQVYCFTIAPRDRNPHLN